MIFNYYLNFLSDESILVVKFIQMYRLLFLSFILLKLSFLAQNSLSNPERFYVQNVSAYSFDCSFSKVPNATKYLVIMSTNKKENVLPIQSKEYHRGDRIGNSKVVQFSDDTIIRPRAIRALTSYFIKVFSSSEVNGKIYYVLLNPLEIQLNTLGLNTINYYESISESAPNFVNLLSSLINNHQVLPYTAYKSTLLLTLEMQDTLKGQTFVECVYSGERKIVQEPFDWNAAGFSREHTFPHSWMPTHPADDPPLPEYSDLHNLYPTNLERANTIRSNFPLGEITGKVLYSYLKGRLGYAGTQIVYEPRDCHKGNAARAMMYMAVAYHGIQNHAWNFPLVQDQEIIKKWHFQDLPDNYEIARQEYIYTIQGNRNPFIDHPEYACYIDFSKMVKIKGKCSNSIFEKDSPQLEFKIQNQSLVFTSEVLISNLVVYDITGKVIYQNSPYDFYFQLDKMFWYNGVYFFEITLNEGEVVREKIVLN